ncbi:N-acetylmuramoyl-L-alanine amidase [Paucisalibacillus sp. EB02]|uniref:N-acetylmuramoyl-L-alanine amidase n=1 Tax=Paucisalibacillus sp. EB02 TaxID=1347087 RepID=UPI0004B09ECF|nr:N-acetylmuramoyl-L-alanine amidase [Paucisalibacillus sp. EB02]
MDYIKRITILAIFSLFFMITTAISAHAKTGQTYEVNTDWLNIRNGPSNHAEIVGKLKKGNQVRIFGEISGWAQTYYNGEAVWIASNHLVPKQDKEVFLPDGLLTGYTIVIDPGHGGKDPGAIGHNGVLEKDLILVTSKKIAEQLTNSGATVILTRADDSFVPLNDRVAISNKSETDAFISIHFNAFPEDYVGGINTYYYQSGHSLAQHIQNALSQEVPLRNRGVIQSNYRVLRDNKSPAILVELGFITNTTELVTLQSESYQDKVARAITLGLIEYFWE